MSARRRAARAAVCLALISAPLLGAPFGLQGGNGEPNVPAPPPPTTKAPDESPAAVVERWREDLEFDLPIEVLAGAPRVARGGDLSGEGEALALVARALFDAGREAEAQALLDAAQPSANTRAWVEIERARQRLEQDELEAALNILGYTAQGADGTPQVRFPERAASWLLCGRALVRAERGAQAVALLEKALELEPHGEGAYAALHMLGGQALAAGDAAKAKQIFDRAAKVGQWRAYWRVRRLQVRESPGEPLPRLGVAQLLMQVHEYARARGVLEDLVVRWPSFAQAWFQLGELERAEGDFGRARTDYDRALELDGSLWLAHYNRGVIRLRAGDAAGARADFEAVVDGPEGGEAKTLPAHLALARALAAAGDAAGAQERYARYRALGGVEPLADGAPPKTPRAGGQPR